MSTHDTTVVQFKCYKCAAGMRALPSQGGQNLTCPICGAANPVPPGVQQDETPGQRSDRHAPQIPVVCSLCSTRMYADSTDVGGKIKCPDCGKVNKIEAPSKPRNPGVTIATPPADGDDYQLRDDALPRGDESDEPRYITFSCNVCKAHLRAAEHDVGRTIRCPDCDLKMTVPAAPKRSEAKALIDKGPALDVGAASDVKPAELMEHEKPRVIDGVLSVPAGLKRDYGYSDLPPPPEHPFATGVLSFLFYKGTTATWITLGVALAALSVLFGHVVQLGIGGGISRGLAVFTLVPTLIATVVWLAISSACHLTIVGETASGNDHIVEWPQFLDFTSWFGSILYGINALVVCVAPAMILTTLVGVPRVWIPLAVAVSVYLTLPVVVLSMLLSGSAMGVFSTEVVRRMALNKKASLTFYAVNGLVNVAIVGIDYSLILLPRGIWTVFIGGTVLLMGSFLTARLIGRLGWVLSQMPEDDEEESDDQEAESE